MQFFYSGSSEKASFPHTEIITIIINPSSAESAHYSPKWPPGTQWVLCDSNTSMVQLSPGASPSVSPSLDGSQPPSEMSTASLITVPCEHSISLTVSMSTRACEWKKLVRSHLARTWLSLELNPVVLGCRSSYNYLLYVVLLRADG